ncbi:MAG: LLM class F420-dependent oxidoreductase [Acidimicrobiaceae bacterium]|nr:LLM class F420-dependent oxidoreductase [Acidimicrobiaceae bacterium]|tara:strand:- start:2170 stop:3018 length:849 start_codon:yes stop_codon:yes gene_type:complete
MYFGVCFFPTAYAINPAELGPALEERGFESVWLAEHSHIPASRKSPWPGGDELPQMYYDTLDPFVTLGAMAATTSTLKLCTGITLVVQRDPIHTAKEVASLDVLSGGRVLFGVGAGWNKEEMSDHGTDPESRFGLMRERIEAMKALWADDPAEYHGVQVDFGPAHQNPKPIQSPHPPIHVGGVAPGGLRRAVAYGNGWIPIGGRTAVDGAHLARLRVDVCAEVGRDPSEVEVSIYSAPAEAALLDDLTENGIERAVFNVPSLPRDEVLPLLDEYAELISGRV